MSLTYRVVTGAIRAILRTICRIDDTELAKVPDRGPLILVANHITAIEVPIIYTHLIPRPLTAFAKAETWEHPLLGPLADLWGAIPLHRGEADAQAFREALTALKVGNIVAVAPEGTRSGTGQLQRGLPGTALLASLSGAPLMPLAQWGGEHLQANLRRLKRTAFHTAVGRAFEIVTDGRRASRQERQAITDEVMFRIAELLPPGYRGVYAFEAAPAYRLTRTLEQS